MKPKSSSSESRDLVSPLPELNLSKLNQLLVDMQPLIMSSEAIERNVRLVNWYLIREFNIARFRKAKIIWKQRIKNHLYACYTY